MPRGVARSAAEALAVVGAADYEPLEGYPGPGRQWRVRCRRCGSERTVEARIIASGRRPCHGCVVAQAERDLAAAGLVAQQVYPGCTTRWAVRCRVCSWAGTVVLDKLRQGRRGCPNCSLSANGRTSGSERRLLPPQDAAAVMQATGFQPLGPYPGSAVPWACRHLACGQVSTPTLNNVKSRPCTGFCSQCMPTRPLTAAQVDAFLQTLGSRLVGDYPGARVPLRLRCQRCGLTDQRRYDDIRASGTACSYCAGKKMHPVIAAEHATRAGLEPLEVFPGATRRWRCRCDRCGRQVTPLAHDLKYGGGCPYCVSTGFDAAVPAVVYLLQHLNLDAYKFGITNADVPSQRLKNFSRAGWLLLKTWHFTVGADARRFENDIKQELRTVRGLPPFLAKQQLPDGWTETVGGTSFSPWELTELIEQATGRAKGRPDVESTSPDRGVTP